VALLSLLVANILAMLNAPHWLLGAWSGGGLIALGAAGAAGHRPVDRLLLSGVVVLICLSVWSCFATVVAVSSSTVHGILAAICVVQFLIAGWLYRRPIGETLGEWPLRVMYRMRVVGPGVANLPRSGPVLVIANHTAFLDPCWVMIPLPRDLTPIMYGEYFKKFGLHFYMKHCINGIPSGVGMVRREAPELDEAVRRLDRGEGILIFPEGWVRRKEDEPIRRFAQGAWRILRDRPNTPVVACWIEGGWGSWSSFCQGPPFHDKRIDFRRPINVGVSAPVVLDAETVADQHRTRELLKEMVLGARRHLAACGLAVDSPAAKPLAANVTESPASPP
jgi:1-acyl-sn-glycerol-3-phosphate acyltransferase